MTRAHPTFRSLYLRELCGLPLMVYASICTICSPVPCSWRHCFQRLWPSAVERSPSFTQGNPVTNNFKKNLKTHLFNLLSEHELFPILISYKFHNYQRIEMFRPIIMHLISRPSLLLIKINNNNNEFSSSSFNGIEM